MNTYYMTYLGVYCMPPYDENRIMAYEKHFIGSSSSGMLPKLYMSHFSYGFFCDTSALVYV